MDTYKLIYNGEGEHRILGLGKEQALSPNSKQLAEWMLARMDYAGSAKTAAAYALNNQSITAVLNPSSTYVQHIHAAKKEEIESKWAEPMLTDNEAAEILFKDRLDKELEKLPKSTETVIRYGS